MALTKISTDGVKDDAVTAGKIPANAVGSSELADNAVDTAAIANNAVTHEKLADSTGASDGVTTPKIANNAVTFAKIENVSQNVFLGRLNAGVGNIEPLSPTQVRTLLNVADGATQATINTNGDNRVITGTSSTNTVQGEPQLTFDSNGLLRIQAPDNGMRYFFGETGNTQSAQLSLYNSSDQQKVRIAAGEANAAEADTFFTGGDVGIGTNTPSVRCDISDSDSNAWSTSNLSVGLRVANSSSTNGAAAGIELRSFQNNGGASLQYLHAVNDGASSYGSDLVFTTRVAYTGAYRESCRITNAGNLKFPSGHGIDFSADGNASGNTSELLHDYEEGTWSANSLNYDYDGNQAQRGHYVKIGRMVFATFRLKFHSQTTHVGNHLRFTGLPFTSASGNPYDVGVSGTAHGYGEIATFRIYVQPGSTYAYWYTDSGSVFNNSTALNNKDIRGTIIYTASS